MTMAHYSSTRVLGPAGSLNLLKLTLTLAQPHSQSQHHGSDQKDAGAARFLPCQDHLCVPFTAPVLLELWDI